MNTLTFAFLIFVLKELSSRTDYLDFFDAASPRYSVQTHIEAKQGVLLYVLPMTFMCTLW